MTWRTVLLTKDSKLSLRMNHLVVKNDQVTTIPIAEIGQVIIENPNIIMTGHILNALSKNKVSIILCDTSHMPYSHVNLIYGHHRQPRIIQSQINWENKRKGILWKEIIIQKIKNQIEVLKRTGNYSQQSLLNKYIKEVEEFDSTNREGHAAKVYFNQIFGLQFVRGSDDPINWALNYGYSMLLSLFTRVITTKGLLTEIGIHHNNQFNQYNLASDFMEVYRPFVDFIVVKNLSNQFSKKEKRELVDMFNKRVKISNRKQYLPNSVEIYVDSMIKYLNNGDLSDIRFPNLFID